MSKEHEIIEFSRKLSLALGMEIPSETRQLDLPNWTIFSNSRNWYGDYVFEAYPKGTTIVQAWNIYYEAPEGWHLQNDGNFCGTNIRILPSAGDQIAILEEAKTFGKRDSKGSPWYTRFWNYLRNKKAAD